MKKKVLILMLGLVLMGANVYAAGDLQVNGSIGLGVSPDASSKFGVDGTGSIRAIEAGMTTGDGLYASYGIDFSLNRSGSNNLTADVVSFAANVNLQDTGDRTISGWIYPVSNNVRYISSTAGTSTISSPVFTNARFTYARHTTNQRNFTVNATATNVIAGGHEDWGSGGGAVNYSDFRRQPKFSGGLDLLGAGCIGW